MRIELFRTLFLSALFIIPACSSTVDAPRRTNDSRQLTFGSARSLGQPEKNPSTPFLRYAPNGRLFAVWSEDHDVLWPEGRHPGGHQHMSGDRAPSPMRNAFLAWSDDHGKSWSPAKRVNSSVEAVQGEENGPKVAAGNDNRAYVVWSIPGGKGDKTRVNIRFAMEDGEGGFTPAKTLNEVKDAARFPIIEFAPDSDLLIAWIDRRIDNPKPRQLYLMRLRPDGEARTKNYQVGSGLRMLQAGHQLRPGRQDRLHGRSRSGRTEDSQPRPAHIDGRWREFRRPGGDQQ